MSVLILLILVSLAVAIGFLISFIWSVKNGQYEDDYTPAVRMLFDDKKTSENHQSSNKKQEKLPNQ